MLEIGKTYLDLQKENIRLCADIATDEREFTLWFAVDCAQEEYFTPGRADAFLMALLPYAMRGGQEVRCADPISERLCYQLIHYLIPALSFGRAKYRGIAIDAPLAREPVRNCRAVGAAFSGSVDSLYTVMGHGRASEYPLTHILVLNAGVFEGAAGRKAFQKRLWRARRFAKKNHLEVVGVDTNLQEMLSERFYQVYPFREMACALTLQGLFSVYLLSCGYDVAHFRMNRSEAASFNLLTAMCVSTESLALYPSGVEEKRWKKRTALKGWREAQRWLHVDERDVPVPTDTLTWEERFGRKGLCRHWQRKRREWDGQNQTETAVSDGNNR